MITVLVLLGLNYLFPYTQYPVTESSPDELQSTTVTKTTFMPIWNAHTAHEEAALKGNIFSDTIILWPIVHLIAALIVVFGASACYSLRTRSDRSSPERSGR